LVAAGDGVDVLECGGYGKPVFVEDILDLDGGYRIIGYLNFLLERSFSLEVSPDKVGAPSASSSKPDRF
jgi:hypothetical protein